MTRSPETNPFAPSTAALDPKDDEARRALAARIPNGLRVDVEACFPVRTGFMQAKKNENRMKLLDESASLLVRCLGPEEEIKYVTLAREQVWWAFLAGGHWGVLLATCTLVITDQRILVIQSSAKGTPTRHLNQIALGAVKKSGGFLGRLSLQLAQSKRVFSVTRPDQRAVVVLVPPVATASGGEELLCPACFRAQAAHVVRCPSCGAAFKSPRTSFLRSLFLPGLGSWYAGYRALGGIMMMRAALLWLVAIVLAFEEKMPAAFVLFLAGFLLFLHVIDAVIAQVQTRRGLIPLDGKIPAGP